MNSIQEIAKLLQNQRKSLGMEQKDMYMRIGMKQQQYQRVEAGSDIRLSTLLRILEGLDLELNIAPKGKNVNYPLPEIDKDTELKDNGDDLDFWLGSGGSDE